MRNNFGRKAIALISTLAIMSTATAVSSFAYNGNNAAYYANKYATSPNSYYRYFEGGDCTNFVSQCLRNGGLATTDTKNKSLGINNESSSWYHQKYHVKKYLFDWCYSEYDDWKISTTWIRVSHEKKGGAGLYQYLSAKSNVEKTKTTDVSKIISKAKVGDVIQLASSTNALAGHSIIVTSKSKNDLKVAYHTSNKKNVSFKSMAKNYKCFYLLHVK